MYREGPLFTCVICVILEEFGALGLEGFLWSDGIGHDCYDGFWRFILFPNFVLGMDMAIQPCQSH